MRREDRDNSLAEIVRSGLEQGRRVIEDDGAGALRLDGRERRRTDIGGGDTVEKRELFRVRYTASASTQPAPSERIRAATVPLPVPLPPVSPMIFISVTS